MTNSKPWEDLKLRGDYRRDNPACELAEHLDYSDERVRKTLASFSTRPMLLTVSGVQVHHIWHCGQRPDKLSNLISLSPPVHQWVHDYPQEGRLLATWVKVDKGELDRDEMRDVAGFDVIERVLSYRVDGWWLEQLQMDLAERF